MVITQNGEATAVLEDVPNCEQTQEMLVSLKILVPRNQQISESEVRPLADVAKRLRAIPLIED